MGVPEPISVWVAWSYCGSVCQQVVQTFCGRVLGNPSSVFDEEFLQPEKQDLGVFADGVENIVGAMRAAALHYFSDGSIEMAWCENRWWHDVTTCTCNWRRNRGHLVPLMDRIERPGIVAGSVARSALSASIAQINLAIHVQGSAME